MKKVFYDKRGDVREVWSITGVVLAMSVFFVLMALLIAGVLSVVDAVQCARQNSYETQHDYRWGLFTGCLVQTEQGYWVDSSNPTLLEFEQGE